LAPPKAETNSRTGHSCRKLPAPTQSVFFALVTRTPTSK